MFKTSSFRSHAIAAGLLLASGVAAPALARTIPASAGRAQLGVEESSFNATSAFVNNTSGSNKLWVIPLIFDTAGSKTVIVRGSVSSGGFMSCNAFARNTSNVVASSSATATFPVGPTTSVTLTLPSVPPGSVGAVHCVLSGSNTALLLGIDY